MPPKVNDNDYIGRTFGNLIIIRRVDSKAREPKWFCLCSCGNNTIVATSKLKDGKVYCSDCYKLKRGKPSNFIDLTGKKFGSIMAVRQAPIKKNSNAQWECICDCGNKLTVSGAELVKRTNCIKCKPGAINGIKKHNSKEKYCPKCKEWKKLDGFPIKKNGTAGRGAYCHVCAKEYRRKWMRNKFYGITDDEFEKVANGQDFKCGLCGRYEELVIDHCHTTGKFRGLICRLCNGLLGRFKDSTILLEKAILYLNKSNESV